MNIQYKQRDCMKTELNKLEDHLDQLKDTLGKNQASHNVSMLTKQEML